MLELKLRVLSAFWVWACLGLATSYAAAPAQSPEGSKAASSQSKKSQQQTGKTRVVVQPGSGETPSERAARLKRECKGLPNAGACTGYAN